MRHCCWRRTGFQIYLLARGDRESRSEGAVGDHHLTWAVDSPEALQRFEELLKTYGRYTDTHSAGGVRVVEGRDPDGIRVVIACPSPAEHPRSLLDRRIYN